MECDWPLGRRALCRFSETRRRRHDGTLRIVALRRQLLDEHRHAHCAARADASHADLRRPGAAAEVWLSDEAAHAHQARLQESQTYRRDHRDERLPRWLLGEPGLQLVRRFLSSIPILNSTILHGGSMSIRLKLGVTLAALAFTGVALAQTPAVKPSRIRGDIVSLNGDVLQVHRRSGDTVSIDVAPTVGVSAVKAMQLSDIKPGSFIGTAATTGTDGKLTAT